MELDGAERCTPFCSILMKVALQSDCHPVVVVGWTCSSLQQWKRMAMVVACSDDGRELFRCGSHTKLHLIEIKYKIHFHLAQSMIDSNLIQVSFYPKWMLHWIWPTWWRIWQKSVNAFYSGWCLQFNGPLTVFRVDYADCNVLFAESIGQK